MYKIGQSKKEVRKAIGEEAIEKYKNFKVANSPDVDVIGLTPDVIPLRTYQNIQIWCGRLIANMRQLDDRIDKLFCRVIEYNDGPLSSKLKLNKCLKELFELKESIRNIEIDVEEFINICATTEFTFDSNFGNNTLQLLIQVNSSYFSTYNLIIYKLKSISNSRVTFANIGISLVALGISVSALYIK